MPLELAAVLCFKQFAAAVEVDFRSIEPNAVLSRNLAAAFVTLVRLTGSLFPALSGATPAPDTPSFQAPRIELLPYLLLTRSASRPLPSEGGWAVFIEVYILKALES
tara:strand:+ start:392 stop:712 length:321 start_codon:yes stop_codon:yes gene_type:complete